MRLEGTILSDLSANVFAALLLILLILLQAQAASTPSAEPDAVRPSEARRAVDAARDLKALARTPMRPGALVAFLYDRRADAPGLSLDLTEGGVDLRGAGAEQTRLPPDRLAETLRRVDPDAPVRLYVLSHLHFDAVMDALTRSGRRWQDLSVPRALRGSGGTWSPAFLALLDRERGLSAFRADLARLLGAGPGPAGENGGGAPGTSMGEAARPGLLDALRGWFRIGLAVVALIGGLGAVLVIERVVPMPVPDYSVISTSTAEREGRDHERSDAGDEFDPDSDLSDDAGDPRPVAGLFAARHRPRCPGRERDPR